MQDFSRRQQRRQGQKDPKPFSNTEEATQTPKQPTLSQNICNENKQHRNKKRRHQNRKRFPLDTNSSSQNVENTIKTLNSESINDNSCGKKFLGSNPEKKGYWVPKQADYLQKQPKIDKSVSEGVPRIQERSNGDSNDLMNEMLAKPSRSEPVNTGETFDESLSAKSQDELIDIIKNLKMKMIQKVMSQNMKENEKDVEKEKKKPNEDRRFFVLNEKLANENEILDYKYFKLDTLLTTKKSYNVITLLETACSFLNHQGGRIYLGVKDEECQVKGMYLTKNDRDQIQSLRVLWFNNISPCALDLITIRFVPIKEEKRFSQIPGLFVVKIVVKPGKPKEVYSASQSECKYWKRSGCSNLSLRPEESSKLFKQKLLEEAKDTLHAWDDPDLETDLNDMNKIYQLEIKTEETIVKNEVNKFIDEAGISCVTVPYIAPNTFVARFTLESFKEEVKKYFNSKYSVIKVQDKPDIPAPIKMENLKL